MSGFAIGAAACACASVAAARGSSDSRAEQVAASTVDVRIGSAVLDLSDRLRQRRASLRSEAVRLGELKLGLEQEVIAAAGSVRSAIAAQGGLANRQRALERAAGAVQEWIRRMPMVMGKNAFRGLYLDEETSLERQIATLERAGPGSAGRLTRARTLDAALLDRLAASPLGIARKYWLPQLSVLQGRLSTTLAAQTDARATPTGAELDVTRLRSEVAVVDTRLMTIAELKRDGAVAAGSLAGSLVQEATRMLVKGAALGSVPGSGSALVIGSTLKSGHADWLDYQPRSTRPESR